MKAKSFGKISVPTPGTPVPVTSDLNLRVERMRFAAAIGDTGRVFLGVSGMTKANGTGVGKEFWPTGSGGGVADSFDIWAEDSRHLLVPSDYYRSEEHTSELQSL